MPFPAACCSALPLNSRTQLKPDPRIELLLGVEAFKRQVCIYSSSSVSNVGGREPTSGKASSWWRSCQGRSMAGRPVSPCRMDIHMPEMDGLEASRQIRQRYAPEDRPRIVALSADTLQVRATCIRCWLPACLPKPVLLRLKCS